MTERSQEKHAETIDIEKATSVTLQDSSSASRYNFWHRGRSDRLNKSCPTTALKEEPIPLTDLAAGTVGWTTANDIEHPYNFPARQKWTWVVLLSMITLLTPFATSILSPAIDVFDAEFGEANRPVVGSLTVTIYLLGYVVGPVFVAPLSEVYGPKWVLTVANAWFCIWQIGCACAQSIEVLIIARFFAGVGGVACLVGE